jgi:hypothetical protein
LNAVDDLGMAAIHIVCSTHGDLINLTDSEQKERKKNGNLRMAKYLV